MNTVMIKTQYWDIAANIYFPPGFDDNKQYPAIISAHPIGSCKEQTAGNVYGEALSKEGFVVIAFDRSTQGQSGGEPRYTEDPSMAVEDFSRVTDYLVTLPFNERAARPILSILPKVRGYCAPSV
ncbi:alpha/beta hydrolase [Shewanella algae]|uniref:alpha/beta hydrolase n=1 Tax=Shewanella algae TaxID=38313 RepID=UPI0023589231|nr:alpha/beta hydrolase [Shewanella algae]MDC8852764.1 alpha/beta hydrolase [Shewanella algae]